MTLPGRQASRRAYSVADQDHTGTGFGRRAEFIGPDTAPLAAEAGQVIFGEPDTRFTEFVGLLLETVARLRADGSRAVIQ